MTANEIVTQLKQKVFEERKLGLEILHLLAEVFNRKIHLERGFSSLHEFSVSELKYTDGQAFRRIKAMQLMLSLPEIEEKIAQGQLSLSNAASIQNYIQQNKITHQREKIEILAQVENKSARETEKILVQLNGATLKRKIEVDEETFQLLQELKALRSHKEQNLGSMIKAVITKEVAAEKAKRFGKPKIQPQASTPKLSRKMSRYIPVQMRQTIFRRDRSCTYVGPKTGRRCDSLWQLEIDHVQPYALAGSNTAENLRLLCDAHNRARGLSLV